MIDKLKAVLAQPDALDQVVVDTERVEMMHGLEASASEILIAGFYWDETPQGYDYWDEIYEDLVERGL